MPWRPLAALSAFRTKETPHQLGTRGERIARRYLRRRGYKSILKNARVPLGEADIVCLAPDEKTIVVVEVKTRRLSKDPEKQAPPPEANITAHKRRKLVQVTESLAKKHRWTDRPLRIDVIAIDIPTRGKPEIRHFQRAVTR